jgi:hypothetical protein
VPPPALPPDAWTGRGCPSTVRATVAPCAGLPHPRLLPHHWPYWGGRTRRRTPRWLRRRSWMVLSSLRGRTGARTSSRAPRQPPSTGAEVATVVGAEVVIAAGEAAPCRGGCLHCWDHLSHLLLSPRLFGFNGLVVAPCRKTGARTLSQRRTC